MNNQTAYHGGENFDLRQMLREGRGMRLPARTQFFTRFVDDLERKGQMLCFRCVTSPSDREVRVIDPTSGLPRTMLMFGSNNYLGLANHPLVRERAEDAVRTYGVGMGGPPLLNGYTALHRTLEERLAALKGAEDALVFSSGYAANVGLVTGLTGGSDVVLYDEYSHASFCDGIRMAGVRSFRFPHNDLDRLDLLLQTKRSGDSEIYVGVEGVYSMDGDLAPLDRLVDLCQAHGAILVVDDAHGTGVMGDTGRGTAEHFGIEGRVPITMATFSKTFAVTGAFVAGPKPVINYLRFFARSYLFSASLPPMVLASVLGGLDVLEREPDRLSRLRRNVALAAAGLRRLGFQAHPAAAIIPLRVPAWMNIREASRRFHERGIFVNSVEYPAVPVAEQRFRISLMADHTPEDIHRLVTAVEEVWAEGAREEPSPLVACAS